MTNAYDFFLTSAITGRYGNPEKVDFETIYSDKVDDIMPVINAILEMWNLENGKQNESVVGDLLIP